jgi:deoxyribonuclease-4
MPEKGRSDDGRYPLVGAHLSIAGGVWEAFPRGVAAGCVTAQIFLKNASQWQAAPLTPEDARRFREAQAESGIKPVVAHDSYLINLASPMPALRSHSRRAFLEEMRRAELLGLPCLVTHPGAHTGSGVEKGLAEVAESLDWLHERTSGFSLRICLENTAGQGTVLAGDFGHFGEILSRVREPDRLGICFDTCHAFAAGYDLRTARGYQAALASLEATVGPGRVYAIHTNDAKGELGSHLDRHQHLGQGKLGLECFRLVMNDPRFQEVPKILETPKVEQGVDMDLVNLEILRALYRAPRVPSSLVEKVMGRVRGNPNA